jgi:hypothetical protein
VNLEARPDTEAGWLRAIAWVPEREFALAPSDELEVLARVPLIG